MFLADFPQREQRSMLMTIGRLLIPERWKHFFCTFRTWDDSRKIPTSAVSALYLPAWSSCHWRAACDLYRNVTFAPVAQVWARGF